MIAARDMAGISVPFAAGVAAGAILCGMTRIPNALLAAMASILALSLMALTHLGNNSSRILIRASIATAFLLTGMFCSFNSALSAGIPLPEGPLERLAARLVEALKAKIDLIPYPSECTAPLVKAFLTGDRSGLGKETIGIFRSSGAAHILALSGLHLGVLYLILTRLASILGNSLPARKARYSLIMTSAGFYTLMTGAGPSIVRALLFIAIGETARLLGREREPARVLLAALTIQLALKPDVISSLGFQLSYLAMTGITLIYPRIEGIYPEAEGRMGRMDPFRKIWNAATLSLSCQAFTAPLVWVRFHTFPRYFLLTNLIALPLTSAVMALSVAVIALSCLGLCPSLLVTLDDGAVGLLVYCLEVISSM